MMEENKMDSVVEEQTNGEDITNNQEVDTDAQEGMEPETEAVGSGEGQAQQVIEKPVEETIKIPPDEAQRRINRMYARLKEAQRNEASAKTNLKSIKERAGFNDDDEEDKPALSRADAEAIWDQKEKEKRFVESETKVLMRHPEALNEDGSFNLKSQFVQEYMKIGRENPMLTMMPNGPELAEAMVEKTTGIAYKQGRKAEAKHIAKGVGAHTGKSTVAVNATKTVKLPEVKQKIARRMNLSDAEYIAYEKKLEARRIQRGG